MPRPKDIPKGIDPRVCEILKNDTGEWRVDPSGNGFWRRQQTDPALPGYETADAYDARPPDRIMWTWLEDINLIDKEGWRAKTEAEKLRGIEILKEYLEAIAKRLGEI